MPRKNQEAKVRGVYEHPSRSGVWWIHFYDADGQRHREKVGRKSDAIDLYRVRKAEALAGKKLPGNLRQSRVKFQALADAILTYSANHHEDHRNVQSRLKKICEDFGQRDAASILPEEIDTWISANTKTNGTANRYRAVFSLVYREALRNRKVPSNPARLVRLRKEGRGRVRYLLDEEDQAFKDVIITEYEEHWPEFVIAVGTGIRQSEQYTMDWSQVNFRRNEIHLPKTKNGDARYVPMNTEVLAAFKSLMMPDGSEPSGQVFSIKSPRKWFEAARDKAKVKDFHWHDCRHTFCSRLAMAGVHLKTFKRWQGTRR